MISPMQLDDVCKSTLTLLRVAAGYTANEPTIEGRLRLNGAFAVCAAVLVLAQSVDGLRKVIEDGRV